MSFFVLFLLACVVVEPPVNMDTGTPSPPEEEPA